MTLLQFRQLTESQQLKLVEKRGVPVAERNQCYTDMHLYSIDGFYVELHHHTHFNVVTLIVAFADLALLEPYLQDISLDSLFESAS